MRKVIKRVTGGFGLWHYPQMD